MANLLAVPSPILGLLGRRQQQGQSLMGLIGPTQADAFDEQMFAAAPNGYIESPQGMYFPADQNAQASARQQMPQEPAQRQRVNPLNVLFRGLAPNLSGALDTERARLQAEADRPRMAEVAAENERIARALGPQALLAFRTSPEKFGESLGYGYRPQVIGQGGIQSVAATGQRISAPQFDEFGNEYRLNDPLTQTSTVIGTRGPSYSEQAQIARIQQDAAQANARLGLDYQRLGQDQQQFEQRLGFDMSKQESRPLSAAQQRQVETYYQEIAGLDNIDAELGRFDSMIASGDLQLSPVANTVGGVRNALGMSTQNSRNLAEFRSTLERVRNDSLRLNKGVQTEGDANRAWNELVSNINDPAVVRQQLRRIMGINERARQFRMQRLGQIENQSFGGSTSSGNIPPLPTGFVLD